MSKHIPWIDVARLGVVLIHISASTFLDSKSDYIA